MMKNPTIASYLGAALILMIFLFIGQCNKNASLRNEISEKQSEIERQDRNYKASLDTVKQSYDLKTGTTKTIGGWYVTVCQKHYEEEVKKREERITLSGKKYLEEQDNE